MPIERIWLAVQHFMATLERSAGICRTSRSRVRNRPSHIANTNGGLFPSSGLSFKREETGAMNAGPPSNSGTLPTKIHQSQNSIPTASLLSTATPSMALSILLMSYRNRTTKRRNHTRALTLLLSIPHPPISRPISRHCQLFPPMACSTIPLTLTSNKIFKSMKGKRQLRSYNSSGRTDDKFLSSYFNRVAISFHASRAARPSCCLGLPSFSSFVPVGGLFFFFSIESVSGRIEGEVDRYSASLLNMGGAASKRASVEGAV